MNKENFLAGVWQRLRKNGLALFSLGLILFFILVAVFGYFISPDDTPFANRQMVEIQAKKPGYTQQFLKVNDPVEKKTGFFQQLLFGKEPSERYIPITGYRLSADSIFIDKYIDEDTSVVQSIAIKTIKGFDKASDIKEHIITQKFLLGTDAFGRDMLSRLIIGTRVSLGVGIIALLVSLTLGIFIGAIGGYYGGKADALVVWLINVAWSIPTLLLVYALTMAIGKGFWQIFFAVGCTLWVSVARLVRGQVMQIKELDYVTAGKALGFSNFRIIFKHILPNILGPLLVIATANFATAIILEAGLSFLGIGVQPPQPSWGLMIKENYNFIITNNPMLALIPGFAIMAIVLALNLLGNGLRDAMDVRAE